MKVTHRAYIPKELSNRLGFGRDDLIAIVLDNAYWTAYRSGRTLNNISKLQVGDTISADTFTPIPLDEPYWQENWDKIRLYLKDLINEQVSMQTITVDCNKHKCDCEWNDLLTHGCQCGGV